MKYLGLTLEASLRADFGNSDVTRRDEADPDGAHTSARDDSERTREHARVYSCCSTLIIATYIHHTQLIEYKTSRIRFFTFTVTSHLSKHRPNPVHFDPNYPRPFPVLAYGHSTQYCPSPAPQHEQKWIHLLWPFPYASPSHPW